MTTCLAFINTILIATEDFEERVRLRNEFAGKRIVLLLLLFFYYFIHNLYLHYLQCNTIHTIQCYDTILQYNLTIQYYNTILRYNPTINLQYNTYTLLTSYCYFTLHIRVYYISTEKISFLKLLLLILLTFNYSYTSLILNILLQKKLQIREERIFYFPL